MTLETTTPASHLVTTTAYFHATPTFPTLQVLPVSSLVPHERCDPHRTRSLEERLKADGLLRNPPILMPLMDAAGHFLVLDGATRTSAFTSLGIPHILAQVISQDQPGFGLKTWNQVVLGICPQELLVLLQNIPGLHLEMSPGIFTDHPGTCLLFKLHSPTGESYCISSPSRDLFSQMDLLNRVMDHLVKHARLDRTHLQSMQLLAELHPDLAGLIVFPNFKIGEIIKLAAAGQMIPAGITRFIISPRALRVNYNLQELQADIPLAAKNAALAGWLQARLAQKGVRSYDETTVMFDE
jgi:hypothetical protein